MARSQCVAKQALSQRGLLWAVGVARTQQVFRHDVALLFPQAAKGRPRLHAVPSEPAQSAAEMLAGRPWRRATWRVGTKGPLSARFALLRVKVADGPRSPRHGHLPGEEEVWLVGEWRSSGERKYYLSNLPARTSLRHLAGIIKARWVCEQAHQQLKQELGLDDFEGRSWTGLHRHAPMTAIACAYLQHLRLKEGCGTGGKSTSECAPTTPDAP